MIERYGTLDQLAEYRRQEELYKTPESKMCRWMGSQIFHFSHADYVVHAWAASRTVEELDTVVDNHVRAKKQMTRMTRAISSTFRRQTQKSEPIEPGV